MTGERYIGSLRPSQRGREDEGTAKEKTRLMPRRVSNTWFRVIFFRFCMPRLSAPGNLRRLLLGLFFQHGGKFFVIENRNDGQFHQITPHEGKFSQGFSIFAFD